MPRLITLILLALAVVACDGTTREEWLHGTWSLAYNPQRDSEDELSFGRDGTVSIHTARDQLIRGKYQVSEDDLAMVLDVDGKVVEVHFEISPDRSRLVYPNGAYYTKRE